MKSSIFVAATAAFLAAAASAGAADGAADIKVWRGGVAGAGLGEASRTAHRVTEIRGVGALAARAAARAAARTVERPKPAEAPPVVAAGGARVWIYQPATGRLTVCRDTPTSAVGASVIDCQATRLAL